MKRQLAVLAAVLVLTPAGAMAADPNPDQTVIAQLDAVLRGASSTRELFRRTGKMGPSEQHGYVFDLPVGSYQVNAACDTDCEDLDLVIFDHSDGKELKRDDGNDDVPVVSFRATKAGRYRFEIWMAKCSSAPCSFGVSIRRE